VDPAAGQVLVDGRDITRLRGAALRGWRRSGTVQYVFQDPLRSLDPGIRISDSIAEGLRIARVQAAVARERVDAAVQAVGLDAELLDRLPSGLSGGQRQRAMIAMALACRPRLLIADEPTTALDVTVQSQILRLLAELRRELSMSILIITHNLGVIAGLTDRVSVMYAGRVVESGSTEDVLLRPRHPYTRALLESVPRVDRPRGERLPVISGSPPDPIADVIGCPFRPRCPSAIQRCSETDPLLEHMGGSTSVACWNPGRPT
jgi:oligopeptide/dipeptide ABC transporter ATP-binding protein